MIGYIFLALIKILDNAILTFKSVATYKEQKLLSSILVIISQLIFYFVVSQIIEDNSILAIIVVSIASGLGNMLAFVINDKFKKDSRWCMIFTSSNIEKSKDFSDYLKQNQIKNIVCKGYDRSWSDVISIIIFSKNKAESRLIMRHLEDSNFKYLLEVI